MMIASYNGGVGLLIPNYSGASRPAFYAAPALSEGWFVSALVMRAAALATPYPQPGPCAMGILARA